MSAGSVRFSVQELVQRGQLWLGKQGTQPAASDLSSLSSSPLCACFGLEEIDRHVSSPLGLSFGSVHEWCLENQLSSEARHLWYPPSFVVCALLGQTLKQPAAAELLAQKSLLAWVGRRIWPTPEVLRIVSSGGRRMFLKPESKDDRLWTIIQLLRSPAVFGVIADGSGLNLIATRRIQLAAQKQRALCFLLRPPWEIAQISTAQTKWKISPLPTQQNEKHERWNIELLRARGLPVSVDGASLSWQLEWREQDRLEQSALALVAEPLRSILRSGAAEDEDEDARKHA